MDNPFQVISEAFQPDYRVNLSIQGLDGTIMLTLSNDTGIVAKRMISAEQREDPKRVKRLIDSIKFGIAIERGDSAIELLAAMTDHEKAVALPGASHRPDWFKAEAAVGL